MSAITQPRWSDGREVVRCECGLIQFKAVSGKCVKSACRLPYDDPEDEPIEPEIPVAPIAGPLPALRLCDSLAAMLKVLRVASGLSQKQLAQVMGCPRTFISKLENAKVTPSLTTLERICYTFEISIPALFYLCEQAT